MVIFYRGNPFFGHFGHLVSEAQMKAWEKGSRWQNVLTLLLGPQTCVTPVVDLDVCWEISGAQHHVVAPFATSQCLWKKGEVGIHMDPP